jgi:hypothetical protein
MERLKFLTLLLCLVVLPLRSGSGEESVPASFDWLRMELTVVGTGHIEPSQSGNPAEWQLQAVQSAEGRVTDNFISAMRDLRIDGYRTAGDVLLSDRVKNRGLYEYLSRIERSTVYYDDSTVRVEKVFPFFGPRGFFPLLVDAGIDRGHFIEYAEYVFSEEFTGLVVDARQQGKVEAAMPRFYDENHNLVYSAEIMDADYYRRWGSVQYVRDPSLGPYESRVGAHPLRIVAAPDDKLIETDIALYNEDARRLLQYRGTRAHLLQGRVIVIID